MANSSWGRKIVFFVPSAVCRLFESSVSLCQSYGHLLFLACKAMVWLVQDGHRITELFRSFKIILSNHYSHAASSTTKPHP